MPKDTIQPESVQPASAADWAEAFRHLDNAHIGLISRRAAAGLSRHGAEQEKTEAKQRDAEMVSLAGKRYADAIHALMATEAPDLRALLTKLELLEIPEAGFIGDVRHEAADGSLARIVADARRLLTV